VSILAEPKVRNTSGGRMYFQAALNRSKSDFYVWRADGSRALEVEPWKSSPGSRALFNNSAKYAKDVNRNADAVLVLIHS